MQLFRKFYAYIVRFWQKNKMRISVTGLILIFILAYFWNNIFISIMPGEAGVLWHRLSGGVNLEKTYGEGLHVIFPFDKMYIYDIRIQELHSTIRFLDTNGMVIDAAVSVRFYPKRESLPRLHQRVGEHYSSKIIEPQLISALRIELGTKTYQDIYSLSETLFLNQIYARIEPELVGHDIVLEEVLLTNVQLPEKVEQAIQNKLVYEQELMAYEYRTKTEMKEKERKQIEGEGIAAFENASNVSILKWEGIRVTEKFALSPNAKVIIIGNDGSSLPVILSADK